MYKKYKISTTIPNNEQITAINIRIECKFNYGKFSSYLHLSSAHIIRSFLDNTLDFQCCRCEEGGGRRCGWGRNSLNFIWRQEFFGRIFFCSSMSSLQHWQQIVNRMECYKKSANLLFFPPDLPPLIMVDEKSKKITYIFFAWKKWQQIFFEAPSSFIDFYVVRWKMKFQKFTPIKYT